MASRFYDAGFEAVAGDGDPTLSKGSTGDAVRKLQLRLNATGASGGNLPVTGTFDDATEQQLKNFQAAYGLSQSGVTDAATWAKLYAASGGAPGAGNTPAGGKPDKTLHMDPLEVQGHVPKSKPAGSGFPWEGVAIGAAVAAGAVALAVGVSHGRSRKPAHGAA